MRDSLPTGGCRERGSFTPCKLICLKINHLPFTDKTVSVISSVTTPIFVYTRHYQVFPTSGDLDGLRSLTY